jgi:hypothetical protein
VTTSLYEENPDDVFSTPEDDRFAIRAAMTGEAIYCLLVPAKLAREEVLKRVETLRDQMHVNVQERPDLPWFTIQCPHGGQLNLRTVEDFPEVNRPSTCGNPRCWFVYYAPSQKGEDDNGNG